MLPSVGEETVWKREGVQALLSSNEEEEKVQSGSVVKERERKNAVVE